MPRIKEQVLKAELAKRGFESVSIKRELPGGRIQVEANKLYPLHVEAGESIYAPVLILGSRRAALISLLSLSMISVGVFFGAPMPLHELVS